MCGLGVKEILVLSRPTTKATNTVIGQPKNETGNETGKSDDENAMEILSDQIIRPTSFVIDSLNSVSGFKK